MAVQHDPPRSRTAGPVTRVPSESLTVPAPSPEPATHAQLEQSARQGHSFQDIPAHREPPGPGTPPRMRADMRGNPLPEDVRLKMEHAFGTDFSSVRVHEDGQADAIGAHAFTWGERLHFAAGEYRPESPSGQRLLGHELTHVVQQRRGQVAPHVRAAGLAFNFSGPLEQQADAAGARASVGQPAGLQGSPPLGSAAAAPAAPVVQGDWKNWALFAGVLGLGGLAARHLYNNRQQQQEQRRQQEEQQRREDAARLIQKAWRNRPAARQDAMDSGLRGATELRKDELDGVKPKNEQLQQLHRNLFDRVTDPKRNVKPLVQDTAYREYLRAYKTPMDQEDLPDAAILHKRAITSQDPREVNKYAIQNELKLHEDYGKSHHDLEQTGHIYYPAMDTGKGSGVHAWHSNQAWLLGHVHANHAFRQTVPHTRDNIMRGSNPHEVGALGLESLALGKSGMAVKPQDNGEIHYEPTEVSKKSGWRQLNVVRPNSANSAFEELNKLGIEEQPSPDAIALHHQNAQIHPEQYEKKNNVWQKDGKYNYLWAEKGKTKDWPPTKAPDEAQPPQLAPKPKGPFISLPIPQANAAPQLNIPPLPMAQPLAPLAPSATNKDDENE